MDRPCLRTETGGKLDHPYLRRLRALCLHGAGGAIRKLESAAFRDPDCTDVSAGGRVRTAAAWHERRHSGSNRIRLRPILMTSLAFILGVVPLAIATGAGAEMRQSLGTAVFFGMLGVTVFGLLFTPTFYTVVQSLFRRLPRAPAER